MANDENMQFPESVTSHDMDLAWEHVRRSKRWEVKDWLALRIYGYPSHRSKYLSLLHGEAEARRICTTPSVSTFTTPRPTGHIARFAFLDMDDRLVYQVLCNILIENSFKTFRKLNRQNRVFGNIPLVPAKESSFVSEPPFNIRSRDGGMYNGQV